LRDARNGVKRKASGRVQLVRPFVIDTREGCADSNLMAGRTARTHRHRAIAMLVGIPQDELGELSVST
jgi:hypothetical protein